MDAGSIARAVSAQSTAHFQSTVGREVAIKIIIPRFANHPDFTRRFETEAQLIARLEHPYITPLYENPHRRSNLPSSAGAVLRREERQYRKAFGVLPKIMQHRASVGSV
jgi:serine/threonine protein kinase